MRWKTRVSGIALSAHEQPGRLESLLDDLRSDGLLNVQATGAPDSTDVSLEVEAEDLLTATSRFLGVFGPALDRASAVTKLEVSASESGQPDLLGATEVARSLGVSRQRVYQLLASSDDFPRPKAELSRGAVWDRREVDEWRDRKNLAPWLVELVLRLPTSRRHQPSQEQRDQLVDEMFAMYDAHQRRVRAGWKSGSEFWTEFIVDASSSEAAAASAAGLLEFKAMHGALIDMRVWKTQVLRVEAVQG